MASLKVDNHPTTYTRPVAARDSKTTCLDASEIVSHAHPIKHSCTDRLSLPGDIRQPPAASPGHRSRSRASDSRITQITITSPAVAEARAASLPRARWTSYGASRGWLSGCLAVFPSTTVTATVTVFAHMGGMSVAAVVVPRSLGMHRQHSTHPRLGLGRASEGGGGREAPCIPGSGLRQLSSTANGRLVLPTRGRLAACLLRSQKKKNRLQPSMHRTLRCGQAARPLARQQTPTPENRTPSARPTPENKLQPLAAPTTWGSAQS